MGVVQWQLYLVTLGFHRKNIPTTTVWKTLFSSQRLSTSDSCFNCKSQFVLVIVSEFQEPTFIACSPIYTMKRSPYSSVISLSSLTSCVLQSDTESCEVFLSHVCVLRRMCVYLAPREHQTNIFHLVIKSSHLQRASLAICFVLSPRC